MTKETTGLRLLNDLSKVMHVTGDYLKTLGKLEQDKYFQDFQNALRHDPKILYKLIDEMAEKNIKVSHEMAMLLLEFGTINQKMSNLIYVPPEEKVRLGTDLIGISNRINKLKQVVLDAERPKKIKSKK